jgi:hypothetical protein
MARGLTEGCRWLRPVRLGVIAIGIAVLSGRSEAEVEELAVGGFRVTHQLMLPGSPEIIYDAMTGDVSGWWDHHFSEKPLKFYIEPRPGGGFYEIFDESGDGVLHGTVIFAQRGKLLRFVGPLGLSEFSIDLVCTYAYEAVGNSTRVTLTVNAAGQLQEGWAAAVDRVWHHFLFEGLKPYVETGRHLR